MQRGRIWLTPDGPKPLDNLITVGESLGFHSLTGQAPAAPPPAAAALDRALAITPEGALARLRDLRIAIVGASGTGSLVAELLMRAGAQNLVLGDDAVIEDVNLGRMLYTSAEDADASAYKVDVLKDRLEASGLGCRVDAIRANVLTAKGLDALRDSDVVFGCVDNSALARIALSRYAYQFLRPYIDVGTEIGTDDDGDVVSLDARASFVAPGRPCLRCQGLIDPARLTLETQSSEERQRVRDQGYSEHLYMAQPAVMDLNARAASLGTIILRHLLQPVLENPLALTYLENLVMFTRRRITSPLAPNDHCDICRENPDFARGQTASAGFQALLSTAQPDGGQG